MSLWVEQCFVTESVLMPLYARKQQQQLSTMNPMWKVKLLVLLQLMLTHPRLLTYRTTDQCMNEALSVVSEHKRHQRTVSSS